MPSLHKKASLFVAVQGGHAMKVSAAKLCMTCCILHSMFLTHHLGLKHGTSKCKKLLCRIAEMAGSWNSCIIFSDAFQRGHTLLIVEIMCHVGIGLNSNQKSLLKYKLVCQPTDVKNGCACAKISRVTRAQPSEWYACHGEEQQTHVVFWINYTWHSFYLNITMTMTMTLQITTVCHTGMITLMQVTTAQERSSLELAKQSLLATGPQHMFGP